MTRQSHRVLGMELDEWTHKSCVANFALGEDWATLYDIQSAEEGKGHATELLTEAKRFYEAQGKTFGASVALNDTMKHIYARLGITEYADGDAYSW
jgi:hypothetical protein